MFKPPIRGKHPLKKKPEPSFSLEEFAGSVGNVGALAQELKELKDEVIEVVDYKIEEVENTLQGHIKTIVDTTKVLEDTQSEAIALINEIKVGPPGADADEKRVADMVRSQFPDAKKLEKDILAKVPKFDEKKLKRDILENIPKASLKVIQSKLEVDPLSVVEKIMALPKGKFKFTMDNVEGLKQTMSAFQSQLGRGYLHGGGDTVAAGTNITITTNAAGQKVINATSGTTLELETNGTPNGSQTLLNLVQGSNVTITDDGLGNVTIAATGDTGVSGVAGTSPIIVDNTDPANPIVTIQQANTSQSGFLSDTDWDTFNNKGNVDTTGTPANNQIAVFTDADTIEGDTNFTWDGTTHTILGTSLLSKTGTATVGTQTYNSNEYKLQGSQWFTSGSVAKTLTGGMTIKPRNPGAIVTSTLDFGYAIDSSTERPVISYKVGDHYNDGFAGQLTLRSGYWDGIGSFATGYGSAFGGMIETQYDGTFAFRPVGGSGTTFSGMRALSFGTHSTYASFWSRWGYGGGSDYGADIRTSFDGTVTIGAGLPDWHASAPAGASGSESLSVTIDQVITGNNASRPALRITKATEQLRLGYDASNYFQATVASTGSTTFNLVGTSPEFTFSDAVNVPDEAYGAGWNGNTEVPTKNAVYDQVELKAPLASPTFTGTVIGATIQANTGFLPDTDGGAYLGQGTQAFSGLFLDTTATINFDNSNVVLTHSSGILTMGTGDLRVTNAGTNSASVVTVGGSQTLTAKTLTSPTITTASLSGTQLLAEGAGIGLDPSLSADGTWSGITMTATAGYTQAFGDLVYLDPTDSRWEACDANAAAGADGDSRGIIGMVVVAGTDGNACTILLQGTIRADANFPTFTVNNPVYVSETAGDVTQTQPVTTDVVIRVVGFALTADSMFFNPDGAYITHT